MRLGAAKNEGIISGDRLFLFQKTYVREANDDIRADTSIVLVRRIWWCRESTSSIREQRIGALVKCQKTSVGLVASLDNV